MQRQTMKRSLSLLMTLVMVLSLLVVPAEASSTPSPDVVLSGPITTESQSAKDPVAGSDESKPDVQAGKTPEEILANCAVTMMKDGEVRTENFRENETSVDVKVQLDPGVDQCYLTIFSYASNTAFDPDSSQNIRLGSRFVKNGDVVTIPFNPNLLPLKVGYSVIASLNVPVGTDWYKPSNSQPLKIVDQNGQGFEDYNPYPNAFISDKTLEAGATTMHISLEADARLFQAAKEKKTSLNVAVRQYPDGSDFDFEAEDQFTVYNAFSVTEPMVDKEIRLTEPLKAGYRVRAVVYWEQNVALHLVKGNDYEAVFNCPDDSVLISGESVNPEPVAPTTAITGPVTPSSKNIVVITKGEIPAGSRLLVKAFGASDEIALAKGTLVGSADAAASVNLTPVKDSLETGSKLVAFLLNAGKIVAQSAPVLVGKDAPAGQGTIALNEAITVDTKSATVTVTGYEDFNGGRLILTIGDSVYNDLQLANVAFNGAGTYTVKFSSAYPLKAGDKILPYLFLGTSTPNQYQPGTLSVVGGGAAAPVELSTAIQGSVTAASKSITVKTAGEIPAGSRLLVKAFDASDEIALAKGTLVGSADAAASVNLTPMKDSLKTGSKLVAFLVNSGNLLAQSRPVTITGEVTPPTADVTVALTDKVVTKGDTVVNGAANWDKSLGEQAQYVLYQFTGETLNEETATKLSEGKLYRSYPKMIMQVRDKLVVGSKLQAVLTIGGQIALSNVITVEPSPDWGTPTVALDVASVSADAVAIPVHVQYDERYLTMGDEFYCDVTLYQFPGHLSDDQIVEKELWENSSIATRIGQLNSCRGDQTLGEVTVSVLKGVQLIPGSKIIAKLRLPHTEWEGEEVDYVSLSVPVLKAGEALPQPVAALLNLGMDTQKGQQLRTILTAQGITVKTLENKDLDEKVGYVAGLPGYEETPGDFTGHHYSTEFMLLGNLSETQLDQLLAAMQKADLLIGHKAMVVDGNKDAAIHELLEAIVDEHNEMMRFQLTELVKKAKALDEGTYGASTDWEKMQVSIAKAENLLKQEQTATEDLEAAVKELKALYDSVLKGEKPTPKPEPKPESSNHSKPSYSVKIEKTANGKITASPRTAEAGEKVTLTIDANQGYELTELTVTDRHGDSVKVRIHGNEATFTMPRGGVSVAAEFRRIGAANPFYDVALDAYYHDAVLWAVENGITSGKTVNSFAPNASCTRAQAVTFLWRAAGAPAPASRVNSFTDVTAGSYYYDAVLWAVENGITNGMTETAFAPDAACSRAQIVTFLWRSEGSQVSGTTNSFADVPADAYYADAVQWAGENGVTAGKTAVTFAPGELCTRAQIVTFLYRACEK